MTARRIAENATATAPLLPRPDRSTAGLRAAVARLTPHQLPEMERQMEEALSLAARTGSLAPLTQFLERWAVTVEIARIPSTAARLREAEYTVRSANQAGSAWREAMEEISAIRREAWAALD